MRPKKKNPDYLIPATHFKNQPFTKAPTTYSITEETTGKEIKVETNQTVKSSEESPKTNIMVTADAPILQEEEKKEPVKRIELNNLPKRVSGLSISSLKAKKDHQNNKSAPIKEEDLPKTPFTEEQMQLLWDEFVKKLDVKGKKILAANLQADVPKLLEGSTTISIELPNSTMKKEVEREQSLMLNFLKEKLQNYDITLQITVNEAHAKKFAFTPEEKYEKLREKNPAIDLLRKEFDLDI